MSAYTIQRYRGKWALVFTDDGGRQHRHTLGTSDPREAQLRAPAVYAELTRPTGRMVADLWRAYLLDMNGRAITRTMTHTFKALRERFGPVAAERVSIADCRAHTAERRRLGIKDGTIHTELGHLRMVLRWALKQRLIAHAPEIERPAKPKPGEKHLTRSEIQALAGAATLPHIRLFVIVAYGTAGRAGAVLGLRYDRVDFMRGKIDLEDPEITIPHKGRAVVPMTDTVREALHEAQRSALSPFVIEWAGKRVGSIKRGLAAAARRAGLGKVTPHMLRHSAAVHMAEAGVAMEEIASYLGHSDVHVTRRIYARFSPNALRTAAAALEFGDLGSMNRKSDTSMRAKSLMAMVGATGIEPVTPTMST